jgi:Flp pilus assembly protein TadG
LIFLGTAEFGRALFQYNTLTKAVRDGARYISQHSLKGTTGVVDVPSSAVAVVETKNLVVYGITGGAFIPLLPGFTTGDVTVIDAGANNVTVTASYNFASIFGPTLPIQFLGGPSRLRCRQR